MWQGEPCPGAYMAAVGAVSVQRWQRRAHPEVRLNLRLVALEHFPLGGRDHAEVPERVAALLRARVQRAARRKRVGVWLCACWCEPVCAGACVRESAGLA